MLTRLVIHNLRCISDADLMLSPGINLIVGGNGSGKTTLIEAIYLLATGRSFRHRELGPLKREGTHTLRLFCGFERANNAHRLGMEQQEAGWLVRMDGQSARRRSDILAMLPVQWLGPDPQQLLSGAPELRRGFIDSGMFHVEHDYLGTVQKYVRCVEQRNAALRSGSPEFAVWDRPLADAGTLIDGLRTAYLADLSDCAEQFLHEWGLDLTLSYSYQCGWNRGKTLQESLKEHSEVDRRRGFTSVGPHRADLVIKAGNLRTGKRHSRGQLKMIVSAMALAQNALLRKATEQTYLLLYDDLSAELDAHNRNLVWRTIQAEYSQAVVTSLAANDLPQPTGSGKMFHVEHGTVSPMP